MSIQSIPLLLFLLFTIGSLSLACSVRQLNLELEEDLDILYHRRCSTCHATPAPDEYDYEDWPLILDEFGPRSGLTDHERSYLEPWLIQKSLE